MNKYEIIIIFRPDLPEKDLEKEYLSAEETIKKHNGVVEKSDKWGKKRLTFKIKKLQEGFFLLISFEAAPGSITQMNEIFKLNGNILRSQVSVIKK